jgi:hypothetical protein
VVPSACVVPGRHSAEAAAAAQGISHWGSRLWTGHAVEGCVVVVVGAKACGRCLLLVACTHRAVGWINM